MMLAWWKLQHIQNIHKYERRNGIQYRERTPGRGLPVKDISGENHGESQSESDLSETGSRVEGKKEVHGGKGARAGRQEFVGEKTTNPRMKRACGAVHEKR